MMILSMICLLYLFGFTVIIKAARENKKLLVSDLVMLVIAPCFVLPVVLLSFTSMFVNVNATFKRFD